MTRVVTGISQPAGTALPHVSLGIVLLVLSMWTLSCLDASGKWVMSAGVPLLFLSWVRYTVHLVLVLALVLPIRGTGILRSVRPREQILRGVFMLCATLIFSIRCVSYLRRKPPRLIFWPP
jgi:hypothetical protein